jgi:nicotinate-nucleotide pyrophosphorylase
MRRALFLMGLALLFCSCNSSGSNSASTDTGNSAQMTDTNNASKNTGTDMSGGVNAGNLNKGDTTGIDLKTSGDSAKQRQ